MVGWNLIDRGAQALWSGRLAAGIASGLLCAAGPVLGADAPIAAPAPVLVEVPPSSWSFQFTPYGWLASVKGNQTVRGRTVEVNETFLDIVMASHAGMTTSEFEKITVDWLATARDPRFKRPYTELVYQPMLELLAYLRANGFKNFIVSGGGIEFMRPWTERIYGVPSEQVIGSSIKTRFEMRDGRPILFRLPEINFIDDKAGKPVGINEHIGRRPIAAFGNSDGDLEMLQWTTMGGGVRFGLIVHHTDAEREYAYDRESHFGRLDMALDAAAVNNWTVVDMKRDWKRVFSFQ